ncbi:MAG: hypothetical protein DWQ10_11880 [Calditrichaeota bacterium]|nr:MAG: hypothetical protein DWQ10_11880 [Calditrichota bacterium]
MDWGISTKKKSAASFVSACFLDKFLSIETYGGKQSPSHFFRHFIIKLLVYLTKREQDSGILLESAETGMTLLYDIHF